MSINNQTLVSYFRSTASNRSSLVVALLEAFPVSEGDKRYANIRGALSDAANTAVTQSGIDSGTLAIAYTLSVLPDTAWNSLLSSVNVKATPTLTLESQGKALVAYATALVTVGKHLDISGLMVQASAPVKATPVEQDETENLLQQLADGLISESEYNAKVAELK